MSMRTHLSAGPLLGFLKPYFVEIAVPVSPTQAAIEIHPYDATQYSWGQIIGEADFFYQMNRVSLIPGLRLNAAGQLDFSGSKSYIRAVEFATFADVFIKQPQLLDQGKNKTIFIGASVALLIGNKF